MSAILNSLYANNLHIFQPNLMILVSKFKVHRALSNKTHLSFGLPSPLKMIKKTPSLKICYQNTIFIKINTHTLEIYAKL